MPKINGAGQPSYAGHEGIVENALGERHELDPSRNDDGTVVDGYESDERELSDRGVDLAVSDRPIPLAETEQQEQQPEAEQEKREEEKPSVGSNSSASATKRAPSLKRSNERK